MKIYLATSFSNEHYEPILAQLQGLGFDVYDFKKEAFGWCDIAPHVNEWSIPEWKRALSHPLAVETHAKNQWAMQGCDLCILILPSGRASSFNFGWCMGQGKAGIVYDPYFNKKELSDVGIPICTNPAELMFELGAIWSKTVMGAGRPRIVKKTPPEVLVSESLQRPGEKLDNSEKKTYCENFGGHLFVDELPCRRCGLAYPGPDPWFLQDTNNPVSLTLPSLRPGQYLWVIEHQSNGHVLFLQTSKGRVFTSGPRPSLESATELQHELQTRVDAGERFWELQCEELGGHQPREGECRHCHFISPEAKETNKTSCGGMGYGAND